MKSSGYFLMFIICKCCTNFLIFCIVVDLVWFKEHDSEILFIDVGC